MNLNRRSKRLTIVEGCDGSGKSTYARQLAAETDALYVHFGPLKNVRKRLSRVYVEAMLPALLGLRDVVFDRSWLSEYPYGMVYRSGVDRVGDLNQRMLERLALRCGAVVVHCNPSWSTIKANFKARQEDEYLPNTMLLKQVHKYYRRQETHLPQVVYDYQSSDPLSAADLEWHRTPRHLVDIASAGNANGRCVLIGEAFAELNDEDPWYRWPFGSFVAKGCSQWLAAQLQEAQIPERELLWVNIDQLQSLHHASVQAFFPSNATRIALGMKASDFLWNREISHLSCEHPQSHKRFKSGVEYDLIAMIRRALKEGASSHATTRLPNC